MATEDTVQVAQQEIDQQTDADLVAGFGGVRGEESPTAPEQKADEPVQAEPQEAPPEKIPEAVLAGFTEAQIKDMFAKAAEVDAIKEHSGQAEQRIRELFGRLGTMNSVIQNLQQHQSGGVKLSPEKFTRLKDQFPELADSLVQDLTDAIGALPAASQPAHLDQDALDRFVSERLAASETKVNQQLERRWLTRQHRDWETVVNSPEFATWKTGVLPKDEAQKLDNSWDADYISDKLTEFKSHRDKAVVSKNEKQKRLEAAVLPRGNSGPSSNDNDDPFLQGFKAVAGRRL